MTISSRWLNKTFILEFSIVTLTVLYALVLSEHIPIFQMLPYWFWHFTTPVSSPKWLFISFLIIFFGLIILYSSFSSAKKVLIFVILGALLQYSFGYSKGGGIEGIRDRMVKTGHAEFVDVASRVNDSLYVAKNYNQLALEGGLGTFPRSKPPGTLLFYIFFDRVAQILFQNSSSSANRVEHVRDIAALTWPILAYFPIPFIFLLARRFLGEKEALTASFLYILFPSVNLINLHTDEAIYPLLVMIFVCCFNEAILAGKRLYFLYAGVLLYLISFFSFGLLAIGFWGIFFIFLVGKTPSNKIQSCLLLALGFIICAIGFWYLLNYNLIENYHSAIEFHQRWKYWDGTFETISKSAFTNLIEFFTWIGVPFGILFLTSLKLSLILRNVKQYSINALTFSIFSTLIFLALFGKTKGESARLWMFMSPLVVISCAYCISHFSRNKNFLSYGLLPLVVAMQFIANIAILNFQDFW